MDEEAESAGKHIKGGSLDVSNTEDAGKERLQPNESGATTSTPWQTPKRKKRKLPLDQFDIQLDPTPSKRKKTDGRSPSAKASSRATSRAPSATPSRRRSSVTPAPDRRTGNHYSEEEKRALNAAAESYMKSHGMNQKEFTAKVWQGCRGKKFWDELVAAVPGRSRVSVYDHVRARFPLYPKRPWTKEDDEELRRLFLSDPGDWKKIGGLLERDYKNCRDRWRNHGQYEEYRSKELKEGKKQGGKSRFRWKEGDDDILIKAIQEAYIKSDQPELAKNVFAREDLPVTLQYLSEEVFGRLQTRQSISARWNVIFNKHHGLPPPYSSPNKVGRKRTSIQTDEDLGTSNSREAEPASTQTEAGALEDVGKREKKRRAEDDSSKKEKRDKKSRKKGEVDKEKGKEAMKRNKDKGEKKGKSSTKSTEEKDPKELSKHTSLKKPRSSTSVGIKSDKSKEFIEDSDAEIDDLPLNTPKDAPALQEIRITPSYDAARQQRDESPSKQLQAESIEGRSDEDVEMGSPQEDKDADIESPEDRTEAFKSTTDGQEPMNKWTPEKKVKFKRSLIRALKVGFLPAELDLHKLNDMLPGEPTNFSRDQFLDKWQEIVNEMTIEEKKEIYEALDRREALDEEMIKEEIERDYQLKREYLGQEQPDSDDDNYLEEISEKMFLAAIQRAGSAFISSIPETTQSTVESQAPLKEYEARYPTPPDEGYCSQVLPNMIDDDKPTMGDTEDNNPHASTPSENKKIVTELSKKVRRAIYDYVSFNLLFMPGDGPSALQWETIAKDLPKAETRHYPVDSCKAAFFRHAVKTPEPWSWVWMIKKLKPYGVGDVKVIDWEKVAASLDEDEVFCKPEQLKSAFKKLCKGVEKHGELNVGQICKALLKTVKKKRVEVEKMRNAKPLA